MIPKLLPLTQLGSAVEQIGRAAAPGTALAPRTVPAAPASYRTAGLSDLDQLYFLGAERTVDEAAVDLVSARTWQQTGSRLGAGCGMLVGLGVSAYWGRRLLSGLFG